MDALNEMLHGFGLGRWAAVIAAGLMVLVLRGVLPPEHRRQATAPFVLLVLHVVTRLLAIFVPEDDPTLRRVLEIGSMAFLLFSFARSGFLITIHAVVMRRLTRPMPKIFKDLLQVLVYVAVVLAVLSHAGVEPGSLLTTSRWGGGMAMPARCMAYQMRSRTAEAMTSRRSKSVMNQTTR